MLFQKHIERFYAVNKKCANSVFGERLKFLENLLEVSTSFHKNMQKTHKACF